MVIKQLLRINAGFGQNKLGAELAVKLNIKHSQTQIQKFYINITKNSIEKPFFRLNVYSKDSKGFPGTNILKQSIVFEPKQNKGFVEVNLIPYSIFVDDDVFISIEWIKDLGNVKGLYFSTQLLGPTYYRAASQANWQKFLRALACMHKLHIDVV